MGLTNDEIEFLSELVRDEVNRLRQEIVTGVVGTFVDLAMGQLAYFGVGEEAEGEDEDVEGDVEEDDE